MLLGKTTYEGKTYTYNDANGIVAVEKYGLGDSFYGGRVRNFGKVPGEKILLCIEKESVIDIYIPENDPVEEEKPKRGRR